VKNTASNYKEDVERSFEPIETLGMMIKTSMYKVSPFVIKSWYRYYSGDVFELAASDEIWNIDNDLPFYNILTENGITINNSINKAFRFYHMRGAHAPCHLSYELKYEKLGKEITPVEQGRASLKIVCEYMNQMRQLGIYDNTTIIITADHGQGNVLDSDKDSGIPDRSSRPILLVKTPYAQSDSMCVSNSPVSQMEIMPTIMDLVGADKTEYGSGRSLDEIAETEERLRECVDIYSGDKVLYSISGNAKDVNCWNIEYADYGE
jgi:hypothetical protein